MSDFKKILGYVGCTGVVVVMAVFAATWIGFHRGDPTRYTQGTVGLCSNVPEPYKTIFDQAGQKWKVQPAFIAAIFYAGEHGNSWPTFEEHATLGSGLNPDPHDCGSKGDNCVRGPMQMREQYWNNWKNGAWTSSNDQERKTWLSHTDNGIGGIEWTRDSIYVATWHLAMLGAGGNTTDTVKLKDAAGQYNGGGKWQGLTESQKYVTRVTSAFNNFYCATLAGSGNIVAVAKAELGIQEVGDDRGAVLKYGGNPGDAWCAYFASWVYKKAGYNIPSTAGAKALYDWFGKYQISFTRESGTPQPGDLVYFNHSHVGIVVSLDNNGTLYTIEGNAGHPGAVREETYHNYKNINDIEGFGRWRK